MAHHLAEISVKDCLWGLLWLSNQSLGLHQADATYQASIGSVQLTHYFDGKPLKLALYRC